MLKYAAFAALVVVGCRDASDPGFEIVKVPMSAYAAADASPKREGGAVAKNDAGSDPTVLCVPKPEGTDDNDESTGCPSEYQGRSYDEKTTTRHRQKDDESEVCCYRKGRMPHRVQEDVE